jgi:hypothetical protein
MNNEQLIGKQFILDLGSLPVSVIVKDVTEKEVTVEYLNSTPGRIEKFSISDFEYFAMIKILNMIEIENCNQTLSDKIESWDDGGCSTGLNHD